MPPRNHLLRLVFGLALLTSVVNSTSVGKEVLLVGGERFDARITSIDGDGADFTLDDGSSRRVGFDRLVRYARPPTPQRRAVVELSDGSRLVAAPLWVGRPPLVLDADEIRVRGATYRETPIPRDQLVAITIPHADSPKRRGLDESDQNDRVWLKSGDMVVGNVGEFNGTELSVGVAGEDTSISFDRLAAVKFASRPANAETIPRCDIWLTDGSRLRAKAIEVVRTTINVHLSGGGTVRLAGVEKIAGVTGYPRDVVYLSDLKEADYRHTPYFGLEWPYERDRNLAGGMLAVNGRQYPKGIAMHSAGRIVYRVPAGVAEFSADVAVEDEAGQGGSVGFRVYVAQDGDLKSAWESEIVRGGDQPRSVRVTLDGSPLLVLVVDFADRGDELDHAAWLDARFEPADKPEINNQE